MLASVQGGAAAGDSWQSRNWPPGQKFVETLAVQLHIAARVLFLLPLTRGLHSFIVAPGPSGNARLEPRRDPVRRAPFLVPFHTQADFSPDWRVSRAKPMPLLGLTVGLLVGRSVGWVFVIVWRLR